MEPAKHLVLLEARLEGQGVRAGKYGITTHVVRVSEALRCSHKITHVSVARVGWPGLLCATVVFPT